MEVFFFQAEDGIRDSSVTGVQTCALPIFGLAAIGADTRGATRISADCGETDRRSVSVRLARAGDRTPLARRFTATVPIRRAQRAPCAVRARSADPAGRIPGTETSDAGRASGRRRSLDTR